MQEQLDERSREELAFYRIGRAENTLKEAEVMMRERYWNATINRLYYACFYAAQAVLLEYDINAQTHAGVKTMLGLHVISKGLMPIECGKAFSTLFDARHSGDYDDFAMNDQETVESLFPRATDFVAKAKALVLTEER